MVSSYTQIKKKTVEVTPDAADIFNNNRQKTHQIAHPDEIISSIISPKQIIILEL